MSFHAIPCWQVRCDWPGCTASPADTSEYSGWGDQSVAHDEATELDWWTSANGQEHYCNDHPAAWASDPDQVRGMVGPYLLIHDGDTDNPAEDDGHVTLVGLDVPSVVDTTRRLTAREKLGLRRSIGHSSSACDGRFPCVTCEAMYREAERLFNTPGATS